MHNFVTKSQLLPISKTTNVHHFYEFQGKQLHQKNLIQKKTLEQFLSKIQQDQLKQKPLKSQPIKPSLSSNHQSIQPNVNKSYLIDIMTSNHSSKRNKPNSTKSFNDFYQKNKRWKENLQSQILKKKQQKIQLEQRELSQCRKPLSQKDYKIQSNPNQSNNSHSLHHAFDSKGPISGWTQRFHEYINKRLPQCPEVEFKPTINKKSKIIAGRMVGKVQDRLIKFGEILKMRKHEMIIEENGKIGRLPASQNSHHISTDTNHSQLFFRLFKEGQKTNRRVKQQCERKQFSFKPSISPLSENLQKKVQQKRQKSPLYTAKKLSKQQTHRLLEMYTKEKGKGYSEVEFQNFMKRNQILLEKKNKKMEQKIKHDLIQEERQLKQCTFIPILNPKSIKMFEKTQRNNSINEDIEYDYSHEDMHLEQSPSQLFTQAKPSSKKTTQMKPKSKYSYPHSYTEASEEFEYEIRTPSKHGLSQSKLSNSKSPGNRPNDISEIDSLEFSGQKLTHSNIFSKHTHHKQNHERDENQVINYELTFSNKKLAHELSEINNIEEEDPDHPQADDGPSGSIYINESQMKSHKLSWDKERQLSQYEQKKQELESSWQSELEKVKNRLQSLMNKS